MYIKEELAKIDFQIKDLEQQKKNIINKFIEERNKRDEKTIIENYDKLIRLYNSKHPTLYDKIIVSCFPIRTYICCGCGGTAGRLTLSMLLKLWSNGYCYNGQPIVDIGVTNSGRRWMKYIKKDGTYGSLSTADNFEKNTEIIKQYEHIPNEMFGTAPFIKEKYSETSISDLFKKN